MNDIAASVKKALFVFLLCFMALIMYITYFELFEGQKVSQDTRNQRLWVQRNKILRGTIYDRNMTALTKSTRVNETTQKTEYLGKDVFAHVIGYVDPKFGLTGLENVYDQDLMYSEPDLPNLFNFTKTQKNEEKFGHNLQTTLNSAVQQKAYDLLGDNKGAVVVLNPKTGEILAMVSKPSYDPNNLDDNWKKLNTDAVNTPLLNRATQGLYPPGSTFKTITAISSLQNINGIMNRTFNDTGKLYFNSKDSLSNFDGESFGEIGFKSAYVNSSNFVFGTLGMELGNDKLKATAEKFYFNKTIPISGVPEKFESAAKFPTYKNYEKGNMAQSGIGQAGVLATPMQMAMVACTVANDGVMMKPYLVQNILDKDGKVVKKTNPEALGTIISKENAQTMKDFMRTVVTDGTGTAANLQGINICGKTGTAEHTENGQNATPHSWFIGFAPYDNPQIAVAVIVEDGGLGGVKAAQIAAQVMQVGLKK